MDTPRSLRERATRWRDLAHRHDGELAALLADAADEAERDADRLEQSAPNAGARRPGSEIAVKR
jgi:hypothetical protein